MGPEHIRVVQDYGFYGSNTDTDLSRRPQETGERKVKGSVRRVQRSYDLTQGCDLLPVLCTLSLLRKFHLRESGRL
jgi:hypothetical protein